MGKPSKLDHEQARKLYDAGQNDTQISSALGVAPNTIARWRRAEKLPSNARAKIDEIKAKDLLESGWTIRSVAEYFGVSTHAIHNFYQRAGIKLPYQHQAVKFDKSKAQELYDEGYSDAAIARTCGVPAYIVSAWREQESLPAQSRISQSKRDRMLELYNTGMSDTQIATEVGCSAQSVLRFRQDQKLPAHRQTKRMYATEKHTSVLNEERASQLYHQGLNDRQIAAELGVAHSTVGTWRRKLGLPAVGRPGRPKRNI